jgi:hypothetical protein
VFFVSTINSDEHSAKRYVRSEPEQPLAPEHRDEPGASSYQQDNSGKSKGESVSGAEWRRAKRAEVQRRRTVMSARDRCDMHCVSLSIADRVARFVHLRRTRPRSATGSCSFVQFRGEAHAARGLGHVERKKKEVRMILLHLYQPLSWPSHLLSMTT